MKAGILFFLAISALPASAEGTTVWYDSKGNVAVVEKESPKAAQPFIPRWVAREERGDRALKGGSSPRRSRGWSGSWGWSYPYPAYGFSCHRPVYHRCYSSAGWRVIIR